MEADTERGVEREKEMEKGREKEGKECVGERVSGVGLERWGRDLRPLQAGVHLTEDCHSV